MKKETFIRYFKGYQIKDCAIFNKNLFAITAIGMKPEDKLDGTPLVRLILIDSFGEVIDSTRYGGLRYANVAFSHQPVAQAVVVSLDCRVASLGAGFDDWETDIPNDKSPQGVPESEWPIHRGAYKMNTINGKTYLAGGYRSIAVREGVNKWRSIVNRDQMPYPPFTKTNSSFGFDQVDGFSETDLYAVGGAVDLWHFNGQQWREIKLPTNISIDRVCCAGDGMVYLGGQLGAVWRGRGDEWTELFSDQVSLPFEDIVWFDGRIWCTNDYGLWTIENGKLDVPDDLPSAAAVCSGSLAVGDGIMMVAGLGGAIIYDGKTWTPFVDPYAHRDSES